MKTKLIHLTGCLTTLLALAAAAHAQTTALGKSLSAIETLLQK